MGYHVIILHLKLKLLEDLMTGDGLKAKQEIMYVPNVVKHLQGKRRKR